MLVVDYTSPRYLWSVPSNLMANPFIPTYACCDLSCSVTLHPERCLYSVYTHGKFYLNSNQYI